MCVTSIVLSWNAVRGAQLGILPVRPHSKHNLSQKNHSRLDNEEKEEIWTKQDPRCLDRHF